MATSAIPHQHPGEALATDCFSVREQFTDEQWEHFLRTRRFVDDEVLPEIDRIPVESTLPGANTRKARRVLAEPRDPLGGNGILLIVGRDVTGIGAFR